MEKLNLINYVYNNTNVLKNKNFLNTVVCISTY